MANNLAELNLSGVWTDMYAAYSFPDSTDLILLNKSSSTMYVYVSPLQPLSTSFDGWLLSTTFPGNWTTITAVPAGSKVWVKGTGKVMVQEFD